MFVLCLEYFGRGAYYQLTAAVAMSDDPTQEFPKNGSFEVRVLSELGAIRSELSEIRVEQAATRNDIAALDSRLTSLEGRLISLEEKVDARVLETRPIWEAVQQDIKRLDTKLDNIIRDLYDIRTDVRLHDKRLLQLEDSR